MKRTQSPENRLAKRAPGIGRRLEVSSSTFPRFDRHLNAGNELGAADALSAAQQILHDAEHPSAMLLPVVN